MIINFIKNRGLSLNNCNIVCDGNSLTSGVGGTSYPSQLALLSPFNTLQKTISNVGISGRQTSQLISEAPTKVDTLYNSNSQFNCVLFYEIHNDIYFNGNARAAVDRAWVYCDARRFAKWKLGIFTCADASLINSNPSVDETIFRGKLNEANGYIKSEWKNHANFIIDISSNAHLSINQTADVNLFNCHNPAYYSDKEHHTTYGYAIIANYVKNAILEYTKK